MNNIYGDGLLSSPELFQKAIMFNQSPVVNGGYIDQTTGIPVRLIFKDEGSSVKTSGGSVVVTKNKTGWSRKALPPNVFLLFKSVVYRLMNDQDWAFQGGFYVYGLEKVMGDNGQTSYQPVADSGSRDFG